MLKLQDSISQTKKERRQTEMEKKSMVTKLGRLRDEDKVVGKEIEKKYSLLQSIYKVRVKKGGEMKGRRKELAMKRGSVDECLLSVQRSMELQNTLSMKRLGTQGEKGKEGEGREEGKRREQRRELMRSLKEEYVDEYRVKLEEEEGRKKRNIDRIRRLHKSSTKRVLEIESKEKSKLKLDNLIKRAHSVSLIELEYEIKKSGSEIKSDFMRKRLPAKRRLSAAPISQERLPNE